MRFLRYPGGKTKILSYLVTFLPNRETILGDYIEPFLGGGSVFFRINPQNAILNDLNEDLINLYKAIKRDSEKVWEIYSSFPVGKSAYYSIRNDSDKKKSMYYKAAKILYLNRTCFKGMWRHNQSGKFNVGYGGEARRWVLKKDNLLELSKRFKNAKIFQSDFEEIIRNSNKGDFIFLDPPYKPGEKDLEELHYKNGRFLYEDQKRLSDVLRTYSSRKKINWAMTNSSHPEIIKLYRKFKIRSIPIGTGPKPGIYTRDSKEVLITNY
jgi:DNA adenine methylase